MATFKIEKSGLNEIRKVNEKLVSYNVEMTEVTGGTFWKSYTPEQIAGTEEVPPVSSIADFGSLMQVYPPIDLYEKNIRVFAKGLGPSIVRVSGSWATTTYYDFDGHTNGEIPEGYRAVLTKNQWIGLLDFVKEIGAKLLISVSNCDGDHADGKPWTPEQAKLLFETSKEYGVPVDYAEFMNEPNMLGMSGAPEGYNIEDFGRDQDAFFRFVRENYPEVKLVGPCACGDAMLKGGEAIAGIKSVSTESLLDACKEPADIFSYHYYGGISDRGAALGGHWKPELATSEEYLNVAAESAEFYAKIRDKYCPGAQMWVTESGDAGMGGNTWASTFMDVIRTADELGRFGIITDGVIFHNTLASSDYGYLDHATHLPRPNYWLVYLWNKLVGTTVFDSGIAVTEGAHVYARSRKDGKDGYTYMMINNSRTEETTIELPSAGECYQLTGDGGIRSKNMRLNGEVITLGENGTIPVLKGKSVDGMLTLPPASVTFLTI